MLEVCVHTVIVDHESFNGFSGLFLKEDFVYIITMCTQTKSIKLLFLDMILLQFVSLLMCVFLVQSQANDQGIHNSNGKI